MTFRRVILARVAGETDIVPHPDGNLNDPNNLELQAFLRNVGMDGAPDPIDPITSTVVGQEVGVEFNI